MPCYICVQVCFSQRICNAWCILSVLWYGLAQVFNNNTLSCYNLFFIFICIHVNMDICLNTYFFNMKEIFSLDWDSHSRHRDVVFKRSAVANISTYCKRHWFRLCRRTKSEDILTNRRRERFQQRFKPVEHRRRYLEKRISVHTIGLILQKIISYFVFCRRKKRFGTTWQ